MVGLEGTHDDRKEYGVTRLGYIYSGDYNSQLARNAPKPAASSSSSSSSDNAVVKFFKEYGWDFTQTRSIVIASSFVGVILIIIIILCCCCCCRSKNKTSDENRVL